jgi:hypothetical protein
MAIPRVFVSSTYYDLKYVRNEIETFIQNLGYDPVLHEKNKVTYKQTETLEDSCYNEISTCDILICIIGNKYGTKSESNDYSITMNELKNAIRDQKKIYVFIQKDVAFENTLYNLNKDLPDFKTIAADNIIIHEFINDLKQNNNNFPIEDFENVADILNSIKSQFAGLFQSLLQAESTLTDKKTYYDLAETSSEIKKLVKSFEDEKNLFFQKFDSTIFVNNQLILYLRNLLDLGKCQIFIQTKKDLIIFIEKMGFAEDSDFVFSNDFVFNKDEGNTRKTLKISNDIFGDDDIKIFRSVKQVEQLISLTTENIISNPMNISDDDLPF